MRPVRYILGFGQVRVTGAEPEGFLRVLAERGIGFWNASPVRDYEMTVRIPARAIRGLNALASAAGCEVELTEVHGLPRLRLGLRRRWPAAAAMLAAVLLLLASQAYVWDIEIEGNETVPDGVLLQALSECGVEIGARWLGFSQDGIRTEMLLRVPELRWMTVTMQGCRARVIVREKRTHPEPVPEEEYASIVAAKAGLVTEVNALRGTAEAETNRAYLPGETLIGGYRTGRFGVQGATRAIGTVRARTWYELTMEAPKDVAQKIYSGGKTVRLALILGKTRINFYKDSSICPANCDKIIERAEASREGRFLLPLAIEKITCRAYETRAVPAEELREELEQMLMEALLGEIGEDGEIRESAFTASEEDGLLRVTLRAECEEQIGRTVPLTEAELAQIEARIPHTEESDE